MTDLTDGLPDDGLPEVPGLADAPDVPAFDGAHFRQVLGHLPTGVTVITADGAEGPVGLAIGSFTSVSLDPPLVAFCPDKRSSSWPKIREVGAFCVNVLGDDQELVCRTFASKGADKFQGIGWEPAGSGSPKLAGVLAWIDCTIEAVHDAGDHEICVGRVTEMDVGAGTAGPLVFYRGGYGRFEP